MIIELPVLVAGGFGAVGTVLWTLILRAVRSTDEKLDDMDYKLDDFGRSQAYHGERLVRLETRAGLDALPVPPAPPPRKPKRA